MPVDPPAYSDFHPVILCTASRQVPNGESSGGSYIQGAADDSESWALGLTAPLFWKHKNELLAAPEDDLPALISSIKSQPNDTTDPRKPTPIRPTQLFISNIETALTFANQYSIIITCSPQPPILPSSTTKTKHLHLHCEPGKVGSRQLRHELPKLLDVLDGQLPSSSNILVACPTGKDHSLGVALATLCLYFSDDGGSKSRTPDAAINKDFIRQRLSWIMVSLPDGNPSRATLQSVNAFLLG